MHLNIIHHVHVSHSLNPLVMPPPESDSALNLKQLEQEGERKVAELINQNAVTEEALMGIINEGNDAFKSAHGRNMTYAEMRGLYG